MKYSKPKGTRDIFLDDMSLWQYMEENIREVAKEYNVKEIRTPVFESTEVFARGVGDETDIVNKEMYTFKDRGDRSITLRPELTAGVVRAYIENGFSSLPSPLKFWYEGNVYRYEKMQKGRYREFSQFGVEIFGSESVYADLEAILISRAFYNKIGVLDKLSLDINSIGCKECRKNYVNALKEYLKPNLDSMCDTCKVRYEKNPLRIIDCKEKNCKEILKGMPLITDYLCDDCKNDFEMLKNLLDSLNIEYNVDPTIVRGLDYYNKTVFEYTSKDLGIAVGGGGRYDGLVEILGGKSTPAVGFGIGADRVILLLKEYNKIKQLSNNIDVYFTSVSENLNNEMISIANAIRNKGLSVDYDICGKSFKAQMKSADKENARYTCIIADEELKDGFCLIKDMQNGNQLKVKLDADAIYEILTK